MSFVTDANTKSNDYWTGNRAIPLTTEEFKIYHKKDSIQSRRASKTYLDSIDKKNNRFKIYRILSGYSYQNTYEKYNWTYDGLVKNSGMFNTVQGWVLKTGFSHNRWNDQTGKKSNYYANFNYGLAEQNLRYTFGFFHQFNQINYANLSAGFGKVAEQFNPNEPISEFGNTISTLFFKNNFTRSFINISCDENNKYLNYKIKSFSFLQLIKWKFPLS